MCCLENTPKGKLSFFFFFPEKICIYSKHQVLLCFNLSEETPVGAQC